MKEIMSVEETAKFLKLPKTTIYKYVKNKTIPGFKIGKKWRFERNTLEEWLKVQMASQKDTTTIDESEK